MRLLLFQILGIILFGSCLEKSSPRFKPVFTEAGETTHKIQDDQTFTFGYLEVPENRRKLNRKTIKFPVYIFKSRNPNPSKDPIIYTVGGPGSTTMPTAQYMNYYKYLDDRDFILVEQRGNAYALPHLDCPEWAEAIYKSNLPEFRTENNDSLFANAALSCREKLKNRGVDLDGYNTNEIAADIDDLVSALGIEKYNLLTISYSTKIAQVLMRDYPEKIRSVVMDSALPLEVSFDEESVENILQSLNQLLSDCESDSTCNNAFPDLKSRFLAYLRDKTNNPLDVKIENPDNGNEETFMLRGEDLITVFTSASTGEVFAVPSEINKLLENDLSSIKEELASLFKGPNNGAGVGMRLSVWCAEEYPFVSQTKVDEETIKYPEVRGFSPATFSAEVCDIWGVKKVNEIENQAIKSEIPVLLINGEYDEITPAKWAQKMKENLPNSFHVVFKGWKHTPTTNWDNQCAMITANDFFKNPSVRPVSSCLSEIENIAFKTE